MGEIIWTFKRGETETPEIVQGTVLGVFELPSFYPPNQFLIQIDGTLVVRDMYSCARSPDAIPVWAKDKEIDLYHD